jgi:thiol-disulfide isomerase/thioredoxin
MIGSESVRGSVSVMSIRFLVILLCWGVACSARGGAPIVLEDLDGRRSSPLSEGAAGPAVLIFITHDCPIANAYAPEYARLRKEYASRGVVFTLVHVDPDATPERLRRHRVEFGLGQLTVLHDRGHRLVRALGAKMTPEAFVVGKGGKIFYRGRVDNLYADYGKRRRQATHRDLRDALDAILAGRPVPNPRTPSIGCYIPTLKLP